MQLVSIEINNCILHNQRLQTTCEATGTTQSWEQLASFLRYRRNSLATSWKLQWV